MAVVVILLLVLVALLVGGLVVGLTLKLLGWLLVGLIVGALARLLVPGPQELGWIRTLLYGLGGSVLGGIVGDLLGLGSILQFLLAIATAALLIVGFGGAAPRRGTV